jgi:hypothetical protein
MINRTTGLLSGLLLIAGLTGCSSSTRSDPYQENLLTHWGFSFVEAIFVTDPEATFPETIPPDGDLIGWQAYYTGEEPDYAWDAGYVFVRTWYGWDSEVYENNITHLGQVALDSITDVSGTTFPGNTPPLTVDHVYVMRCADGGWAKFQVLALDAEEWEATVRWAYSADGSF